MSLYLKIVCNQHLNVFQALAYFPQHEAALSNRKRTAPVVDRMDLKLFRAIDDKRDLLKDKLDVVESFDAIKREAYYWHIYHSVSNLYFVA